VEIGRAEVGADEKNVAVGHAEHASGYLRHGQIGQRVYSNDVVGHSGGGQIREQKSQLIHNHSGGRRFRISRAPQRRFLQAKEVGFLLGDPIGQELSSLRDFTGQNLLIRHLDAEAGNAGSCEFQHGICEVGTGIHVLGHDLERRRFGRESPCR
jgi:hypothetical protein